ncbi:hypothetical protein [Candidatus Villigracilis proximus]|uniref:hypothetical protein n=1 Tax=Candidatus Villigracilis proximus TaxID=3140683 RepID=UPI0031EB9CB1
MPQEGIKEGHHPDQDHLQGVGLQRYRSQVTFRETHPAQKAEKAEKAEKKESASRSTEGKPSKSESRNKIAWKAQQIAPRFCYHFYASK